MPDFGQVLDIVPVSLIGTYTDSSGDILTLTETSLSVTYTYGWSASYTFVTIYEKRIILTDTYENKTKVVINSDGTVTFSGDTYTKQTTTE